MLIAHCFRFPFRGDSNNSELKALVIEALKSEESLDIVREEINTLVYELYGLTEEEIRIVEGNT
jgi:hypothetical protein